MSVYDAKVNKKWLKHIEDNKLNKGYVSIWNFADPEETNGYLHIIDKDFIGLKREPSDEECFTIFRLSSIAQIMER